MEAVVDAKLVDAGAVILDEVAGLEAERAQLEARIASRLLDFSDLRRRESELHVNADIGRLEASFAADELSLVLLQPTMTVQRRLAEARRVRGKLPLTWAAWADGRIDQIRVRLIAEAVDKLEDNHAVIELDDRVVAYACSHTVAQTRAWLNRFVARSEPDRARDRERSAFDRRSVYVSHEGDGMSWIHALVSTTDAVRVDRLLTGMSKNKPADGVTVEQRRADLFTDLLLGRVDDLGNPTGTSHAGAVIGVTVPITTLVGLGEAPGESFDHRFTLPADLVRDLANQPGTLFYRLLTDPLGRLLDVIEIGRFPSAKLQTALNVRDGVCAFPTCNVPADHGDADHVVPVPRGPTTASNLKKLCRRHHRFKTHRIVGTVMDETGHSWIMPTGKSIRSETYPIATLRSPTSKLETDFATYVIEARHAA